MLCMISYAIHIMYESNSIQNVLLQALCKIQERSKKWF